MGRISVSTNRRALRYVRLRFERNPNTLTERQLCEVRRDEPANRLQPQLGHPPGEPSADAIRIDQPIDDFHYPRPVTATRDHVDTLLELRRGIGHGH